MNYGESSNVRDFYDNTFQHGAVPLINKPTRVTAKTATLIDNILTNSFFERSLKKGLIKTHVSDHFPIFASINISKNKLNISKETMITRRIFSERNKVNFKNDLRQIEWEALNRNVKTNTMYENFSNEFLTLYDKHFPLKEYKVKNKDLVTPWITKGMKKSSNYISNT